MKCLVALVVPLLAQSLAGPLLAQGAPARPTAPPSNDRTGVSIDRYIGEIGTAFSRVSHDVMFTRSILRKGDPLGPGERGAVLRFNNDIGLATLMAGNATPLTRLTEQLILLVQSGEGRLDDGSMAWDLKPGIAAIVPPSLAHRFTSTGPEPLMMLMLTRDLEAEVTPRRGILVRDVNTLAFTEQNVHWSNMAKYVFSGAHPDDGIHWGDRVYIVYMGPMTMAGPHAHPPETEEVWIKLTDGDAVMQLGSEIRRWPKYVGFLVPPNGQTVHAALNLSDEVQAWFYFARHDANAPRPDPNAARPPGNPVIADALQRATIAGQPLQQVGR
jgi:mannose-6-phosphate isomerase-like protein (cupin superfamily)